jgi:predicted flavoprotein YhiN
MPLRLAKAFAEQKKLLGKKWAEVSKKDRQALKELDDQTMMARNHPGLYFIGECVDVTGHLGGHNFQWAWASGFVCAHAIT